MPQGHQSDPRVLGRRTLQQDHRRLAELLRPGMSVLDAGCGTGAVTAGIAAAIGPSGQVLGIDRDGSLLEIARAEHGGWPNLRFEIADLTALSHFGRARGRHASRSAQVGARAAAGSAAGTIPAMNGATAAVADPAALELGAGLYLGVRGALGHAAYVRSTAATAARGRHAVAALVGAAAAIGYEAAVEVVTRSGDRNRRAAATAARVRPAAAAHLIIDAAAAVARAAAAI